MWLSNKTSIFNSLCCGAPACSKRQPAASAPLVSDVYKYAIETACM